MSTGSEVCVSVCVCVCVCVCVWVCYYMLLPLKVSSSSLFIYYSCSQRGASSSCYAAPVPSGSAVQAFYIFTVGACPRLFTVPERLNHFLFYRLSFSCARTC
jgi:hypothetical protein